MRSVQTPQPGMATDDERRAGQDRRRSTLRALLLGSFHRRRRLPRRGNERHIAALDWHSPQWLAVGLLILLLSVADALLTITLISLGANEANPVMEPLVQHAGVQFALWKMALTSSGVVMLILLARMRAFGRIPVGLFLYGVLLTYIALVGYELWLLDHLTFSAYVS